jgi:hypothetical protein
MREIFSSPDFFPILGRSTLATIDHGLSPEGNMTHQEQEAAIAAFIQAKGITQCPTAFAARTQASVAEAERAVLHQHEEERAATRAARRREAATHPEAAA